MAFQCGIIGLPNVGKSALFNMLVGWEQADSRNFPFCTKDPNKAIVPLQDQRVDRLCEISKSLKKVYAEVTFVDIAGLIKNSSKGAGLGNQFLHHISQVDSLTIVARCFPDSDIIHVLNKVDPIEDFEVIREELKAYDEQLVKQHCFRTGKEESQMLRKFNANEKIDELRLLSQKKYSVTINGEGELAEKMKTYCLSYSIPFVQLNVKEMNQEKVKEFINLNFKMLGLIQFFTTGKDETKAWIIKEGMTALEASGKIHSSFIKNFIRAEITSFENYSIKQPPHLMGKNYIMQDGEVVNFRIGKK